MSEDNYNTGDHNTGNFNTGDHNTGYFNTGNYNTGNYNAGDRNTGDRNTGDHNTGYFNTGCFNTGHWNTGDRNTGDRNTGDYNTGHRNAGDYNTGNYNTGDRNTGNWNSVNREVGFFNTISYSKIRVFNKETDLVEWINAEKPNFLYFDTTSWVSEKDMTTKEKEDNPTYKATGGYLKKVGYKEAFQESFSKATQEDIELLKKLPNFDAEVFKEISGIDLTEKTCNNKVVEIDGKKYKLIEV